MCRKGKGNYVPGLCQEIRSLAREPSWLPRNITHTPFHCLGLLALMMVTVAGLAMWKGYSKAVTLDMSLVTFQIMSKGDIWGGGVAVGSVLVSHLQLLLARNARLCFAVAENDYFPSLTSQM